MSLHAEILLRALVKPRDRDMIVGDLIEEYRETVIPEMGALRARLWFCGQVLSFLRWDGLTCLRAAILPDCFFWAAVAGVAEYTLLFALPQKTGASLGALLVWLAATLLAAGAASGIRTAADAWLICRATVLWSALFGVVIFLTVRATAFTPVPLIIAFLVIVPLAGFQSARNSGVLRTGSAVGLAIGTLAFLLGTLLAAKLHLPHLPRSPLPPAVAVILGTVGAIFGKRFV